MNWYVDNFGFIEVKVSPEMLLDAEIRNKEFYNRFGNRGTHLAHVTNQRTTGYLAEMAVKAVFTDLEFSEDYNIDFILNGASFDVKAQGCNVPPKLYHNVTLCEEQATREVDFYIFCKVKNDHSKVWIAGFIPKTKFLDKSELKPIGTVGITFVYDFARYEIQCKELDVIGSGNEGLSKYIKDCKVA